MSTKTSHYKAADKRRGFTPGELAGILTGHSPNADYRVLISFRGKVRELIVEEDEQTCETPADVGARSEHFPRDFEDEHGRPIPRSFLDRSDGQEHGGKREATFHPELMDEALNARFGDPRLSNLDRRDGLK